MPELVNATDIARRLHPPVTRQRVSKLAERDTFPRPRVAHGRVTLWDAAEVATWARDTGRTFR